ncbi:hypothetical protein LTR85_008885 [Meristemomyces frigidus]|nr:hypothetical protein LTR85_008885 [Meristemomyces frigidus]
MHSPQSLSVAAAILCGLNNSHSGCLAQPALSGNPPNTTTAGLTQPYYPAIADCVEYTVPVSIVSESLAFNYTHWEDDYELEDFISIATTRASADFPSVFNGTTTVMATYQIAASFCTPKKPNGKEKNIILATHGIGQARTHWNSPYKPEEYNFVQWAVAEGYSVWFYDRLGNGQSDKVSGFQSQVNDQVEVLRGLAGIVRDGQYTNGIGKPDKLAVMGFSFGSYVTHHAVATYPEIADAAILTGIGLNTTVGVNGNGLLRSFVPRIASVQNAERFGDLDNGYLTWADGFSQINTYFKAPFYDIPTATFAEANKNAFSITEFLTFAAGDLDAGNFTGAALAITGENDYIVCDGYCPGIFEEPARTYYRNAKTFVPYIHPNSSHNLNFHHNATGAYKVITDFLDANL